MAEFTGDPRAQRALDAYRNMVRATESLGALLSRQLATFGLTLSQFELLAALLQGGPLSQAELVEALLSSNSNMNLVTGNLHKRGLVVRRAHERDRRKVMVHLTPAGQKLIAKVFPRHCKVVRARMSALLDREQETLRRLCEKLDLGNVMKFVSELTAVDEGDEP